MLITYVKWTSGGQVVWHAVETWQQPSENVDMNSEHQEGIRKEESLCCFMCVLVDPEVSSKVSVNVLLLKEMKKSGASVTGTSQHL